MVGKTELHIENYILIPIILNGALPLKKSLGRQISNSFSS